MDVLYASGPASAGEVCSRIPDAASQTAMRTLLRILEAKGHVTHERVGLRHVYTPTVPRRAAQTSVIRHVLGTFFGGSTRDAVATLLDVSERELTSRERSELIALIREVRAATHAAGLIGMLAVTMLGWMPIGWWARVIPAGIAEPDGNIAYYLPAYRALFQGDLFQLPERGEIPPASPMTEALARVVAQARLRVDHVLSVHGRSGTWHDVEEAVRRAR